MKRFRWGGTFAGAAIALGATTAEATPVDDLRAGTSVFVEHASGRFEGDVLADGGFTFHKLAGELDFSFGRADLGLGEGPPLTLHVTPVDDTTVEISLEHAFEPIAYLGGDVHVTHAFGSARARVRPVDGSSKPYCSDPGCAYSVRLELIEGSRVTILGEALAVPTPLGDIWADFTRDITDLTGRGYGGVARRALESFEVSAPEVQCASPWETRTYWGVARLEGPAPVSGALVRVEGSDPRVVPPRNLWVRPGATTVTFPFRFGPAEKGLFALRAGAGGTSIVHHVRVRPCVDHVGFPSVYRDPAVLAPAVCVPCLEEGVLTKPWPGVFKLPEGWVIFAPDQGAIGLDGLVGGRVLQASIGALGDVGGNVEFGPGEVYSFRLSGGPQSRELAFGPPAWSPVVGPSGTVFSTHYGPDQRGTLLVHGAAGVREVALPEGVSSVAGALTSGEAVVNTNGQDGPRAWVVGASDAVEIPRPERGLIVAGVNASGRMVAVSYDDQWNARVVTLEGPKHEARPVDLPGDFAQIWPVGLDDDGLVLVNAWAHDGNPVPLLVEPGGEFLPLAQLVDSPGVELREAVSIAAGGAIVARARRQGVPTLLPLEPSYALPPELENAP